MKPRFPVLVATVLLGAPFTGHAYAASPENQDARPSHVSDATPAMTTKGPVAPPHASADTGSAAGANWIDSRMAREWWKDN